MNWKHKIDECLADELEEMIIENIKAGFLSDDEITEECLEYIEEDYPDDSEAISEDEFPEIIKSFRDKYQNNGNQENYLKLDAVFHNLGQRDIVALHYAGYTQSDGFDDCNEIASIKHNHGDTIIGCCFYTAQDLGHILHDENASLYLSFGNYFETPTAEDIGQIIVEELQAAGFSVQWNHTANTKIAIQNFKWDKYYDNESC